MMPYIYIYIAFSLLSQVVDTNPGPRDLPSWEVVTATICKTCTVFRSFGLCEILNVGGSMSDAGWN